MEWCAPRSRAAGRASAQESPQTHPLPPARGSRLADGDLEPRPRCVATGPACSCLDDQPVQKPPLVADLELAALVCTLAAISVILGVATSITKGMSIRDLPEASAVIGHGQSWGSSSGGEAGRCGVPGARSPPWFRSPAPGRAPRCRPRARHESQRPSRPARLRARPDTDQVARARGLGCGRHLGRIVPARPRAEASGGEAPRRRQGPRRGSRRSRARRSGEPESPGAAGRAASRPTSARAARVSRGSGVRGSAGGAASAARRPAKQARCRRARASRARGPDWPGSPGA